jgi:hypothetical protein
MFAPRWITLNPARSPIALQMMSSCMMASLYEHVEPVDQPEEAKEEE